MAQAEAPASERPGMRRSVTGIAAKVTLLDSKQSHLKAIGIHALAASLSSAPFDEQQTPRGEMARGDAEVAGALRIVEALSRGAPDAFSLDQLATLSDLLPTDDDLQLLASYAGPVEALGVVERFTHACGSVPFCRERAAALLTRTAFRERVEALHHTLSAMLAALATVRASAEGGALRRLLSDALRIYRFVNEDEAAHGFRLAALARFETYTSADRRSNLLQFLARQLRGGADGGGSEGVEEMDVLPDLANLEDTLSSVGRVVWSDVRDDVDATARTVDELRELLTRIDAAESEAGLTAFVRSTSEFIESVASSAVEAVRTQHGQTEAAARSLLRFLAVDDAQMARPEETFATLHEVVLSVTQTLRFQALAAERARRLARLQTAVRDGTILTLDSAAEGAHAADAADADAGGGETMLLVDDVAGRFSTRPGELLSGADRSAELLRLLSLRRASIVGARPDDEEEEEDDEEDAFHDAY